MGIGHLVRHLRWGKEIGQYLKILISQGQLHSGLNEPILKCPEMEMHYLEPDHISHIHEWLLDIGDGIWVENTWVPCKQREHDESIMNCFMSAPKRQGLTKGRIMLANKVRLWFRVITVADLADENDHTINPTKFDRSWRGQSDLN